MYAPTLADRVVGSPALRRRQRLGRVIGHAACRIEIDGIERVPTSGPVVLAANHRSALDGIILFALAPRPVNWIVKSEAFTPWMGPVLHSAGQIPVNRGLISLGAVRSCLRILDAGGVIGIFPEGQRGDGLVRTAKPGVGYLALRGGAAVVPIACHGTELLSSRRSARRPRVRLVFGDPIRVDQHPAGHPLSRRVVAAQTEYVRIALADLVARTTRTDDSPLRSAA